MRLHKIKIIPAGALAIAAIACTSATASAHKTALKAHAPIQARNEFCGVYDGELSTIGTASYKRVGNVVSVAYKLKHGLPDSVYTVSLWEQQDGGAECEEIGELTKFRTNGFGSGTGKGEIVVPAGDSTVFATGYSHKHFNNSLAVELPEED